MSNGDQGATQSRKNLGYAVAAVAVLLIAILGVLWAAGVFSPGEPAEEPITPSEPSTPSEPAEEPEVKLPSATAQEAMYFEQVWSAPQINDLVNDKYEYFELSDVTVTGEMAEIRVKAAYRKGGALTGDLVLRQFYDLWYFTMITRDGHEPITPISGTPDMSVAQAMVETQAANQEIPVGFLNSAYTTMTVEGVTMGSGTATIDVVFSGGTADETDGQITCISKTIDGTTYWFITGFAKE